MAIVQCVPNFSEGRNLDKIEKIVNPLRGKEGVKLSLFKDNIMLYSCMHTQTTHTQ